MKEQTAIKEVWTTLKEYFGDGYIPGSAPFRYDVHYCKLNQQTSNNPSNLRYGVELDEHAMPLFSVLGDTCAPPCCCSEILDVVKHIDEFVEIASDKHPNDYEIMSGKNDSTVDQVCLYALRDVLCWWVHWGGGLRASDYWKHIYVAFAAIPDDFQLPLKDFLDGSFKFLGHSWNDCREGLLSEGVSPDIVELAEMGLWRQMFTQYLEKVDPGLRPLLTCRTTVMTQYRVHTANTLGCAALLASSMGVEIDAKDDNALEMASIAQCLSMDMAKEAMGVLEGEKTETVAGNRAQLKRELRWVYVRCMNFLGSEPSASMLRRYASSGLHYVPMMDRYIERRRGNIRYPISEVMGRLLEPYIKQSTVPTTIDTQPKYLNIFMESSAAANIAAAS